MSTALAQMLRGKKVEPIKCENCLEPIQKLVHQINEIIYSYNEILDFILPLSQGILNINPPRARNLLASPFKELHSQLRTLVWQVQQIAKGDYKQRVYFMGEFSDAFNSMVEALEEKDKLAKEHIRHLESEAIRLRESESRYASAVKNSPGGVYIFDPETMKVIETNEKFNTMMGYGKEDVSRLTVYDFYLEKITADEDICNILLKSLHSISNHKYKRKDGSLIDVDINTCWSESGQSSVVIVSVQDVTQRNKAQEIAAKYKVLLENARDIMLFVNPDGKIIEANKAAETAYGYSHDELLSMTVYDLHGRNDRLMVEHYMQKACTGGITYESVHFRKDGFSFPVEISSQRIEIGNQTVMVSVIRDISDRKRVEESLRYFASYDSLTRVPNRSMLEEAYAEAFNRTDKDTGPGALLMIDVDNFKFINDTFGHTVGDMLLMDLVSVLQQNLNEKALIARIGGDEFSVLLRDTTIANAKSIAEKLRRAVEQSRICPDDSEMSFKYTISIGVAPIEHGGFEFREIMSQADYALYKSKEKGRNRVFCLPMDTDGYEKYRISEANKLMLLINEALEANRFVLFFQPIVDITSGEIVHHEALMRIVTETGEMVYPSKVIPIAERFGLMSRIDRRIVKLSFDALEKYSKLKLFVNLSGVSVGDEALLSLIEKNIHGKGIEPSRLGFEITETTAVRDYSRADRWIRQLREKGCRFALDDFGIGFSSFSYLQYLPVDYVKIDGSYVHGMDKNYKNRALVQAMNTVATSLGKEVIAEFVECSKVIEMLKEDKVGYAQGYYLGHPEPVPRFGVVPCFLENSKTTCGESC